MQCAGSISPIACTVTLNGPRVMSPPISCTSYWPAIVIMVSENALIQSRSTLGKDKASVSQAGVAPIAARSLKLTATALYAISSGLVLGGKCTVSTSVSVVTASCFPGGIDTIAQSSPTPRVTSGRKDGDLKYFWIRSNSPNATVVPLTRYCCLYYLVSMKNVEYGERCAQHHRTLRRSDFSRNLLVIREHLRG